MTGIELQILDFIQENLRSGAGDFLMPLITSLGNAGIFWILLCICLLINKKQRKVGTLLMAALVIDFLLCNVLLKNLVARTRPFDVNTGVQLLIAKPHDFSFPSGHTAASFASVTVLYMGKVKYWYLALILAAVIAFSRLYLYVHFPTDVLGGIVVGVLSGALAALLLKTLAKRSQETAGR